MKNNSMLEYAIKASVAAGKILLDNYNEKLKVSSKESHRDIVTEIDKLAEDEIISILKDYDENISIITEEQGNIINKSKDKYWLIDALDGTVNYINRIPFFCVSIAYIENEIITVAAIYVPMFDDIYFGARGIGAFKNNEALQVSESSLNESLFAVSFSGKNHDPENREKEFNLLAQINDESRGCLRTGSVALNLAFLAEGRLNGCWGKANKYWDIAAGLLLAELAGNKISVKTVNKVNHIYSYLACRTGLWDTIYPKVNKVLNFS